MGKSKTAVLYQSGFGNEFASEAVTGALPQTNSPQNPPMGLYAEQISGTAFTVPQKDNRRTWFYRIRPSVLHKPFTAYKHASFLAPPFTAGATPNQLRFDPLAFPKKSTDMIDGIVTIAGGGDPHEGMGLAVHRYAVTASMAKRCFYNADGEMLFVPETGGLRFRTEMGVLDVAPGEIAVMPRGVKFSVDLQDKRARGYICENFGAAFTLPDLGPIGANGLAYPRHFLYPTAAYEDKTGAYELLAKFDGKLWRTSMKHAPLDVVAWHGNYAPYKYDLSNFNTINTASFDHPDPSIFTVLTSPSDTKGVANSDFVIFPPRWMVAEDTFRPPYFHRNVMSEFVGLIQGVYDGKEGGGVVPGGGSLHNCMSAHGPDAAVFEKASKANLKPAQIKDTLAFMFESRFVMRPVAAKAAQKGYYLCWQGLKKRFKA